jgi:hypothetical protein
MTTAPENRGGANGGPQYNPANVNGRGGNGQSGKASGFKYGMNKTINDQRQMGNTAVASTTPTGSPAPAPKLPLVTPITAPSEFPDQSVMDGAPIGDGANSIPGLPLPVDSLDNTQFNESIQSYSQVMQFIASQPTTSKETRAVINTLLRESAV